MFELLQRLGIDTTGFDRWVIHGAGAESTAVWAAVCIFLLLFLLFSWPSVRGAQRISQRALLFLLRVFAAALVIGIIFQPALRLLKTAQVKNNLAVLIDTSQSMAVSGQDGGKTRIERVAEFLEKHDRYFNGLDERFSVHYFGFDQELHAVSGSSATLLETAAGRGTCILESLSELGRWWGGGPLAGVIFFSDGQDTARLKRVMDEKNEEEPKPEPEIGELAALGAPVNTILAGSDGGVSDVSVREIIHDEYAFVHNPFDLVVRLGISGEITSQVTVTLKSRNQILSSRTVEIEQGRDEAEVKLEFIPRQVGEFFYTVEVPVYAGEASEDNNRRRFVLTVLRDKVRVLYIVGNPSWDERFLRRAMKKNPSVDLVSFYILREYFDRPYAPESELSLIPFPTHELFTNELETFDLVIFQNFFGAEYMRPEYMVNLRDFVFNRGGGLLVIGGIRSFIRHPFNYPLEEVLPVRFSSGIPNYREGEFRMRLTQAGLRHPVTELSPRFEENVQTWETLPALDGFNHTLGAHPDGLVLGEHPFERGPDGNLPVIAVRDAGEGRSMVVAADSTWRWNFLSVGEGRSDKPYQIFWDRALRWLLKDPQMKAVSLTRDRGRYQPGEKVTLALEVLDTSYEPAEDADVNLEVVEQPAGSGMELPEPEPAGKGKYIFRLRPGLKGGYRIRATAELNGRPLGSDDTIFEVTEDNPEFDDLSLRPDVMKLLADRTGGASIGIEDSPDGLKFQEPEVEKIIGTKDFPLWDNALALVLVCSALIMEWFLRRRWGLS